MEFEEMRSRGMWPTSAEALEALQRQLGAMEPPPWKPGLERRLVAAGAFVASATGLVGTGEAGDPLWAGAVAIAAGERKRLLASSVVRGSAGGPYVPGLLALREGPSLERAVRSLGLAPDVVLVDGTGRDHPRRAGIAVHLGSALDVPTVGVTVRPLVAPPVEPAAERGAFALLLLEDEIVGFAVRTRRGARPVFAHAGWRTDPEVALEVVRRATGRYRTPEPIRLARQLVRETRARDEGRAH